MRYFKHEAKESNANVVEELLIVLGIVKGCATA